MNSAIESLDGVAETPASQHLSYSGPCSHSVQFYEDDNVFLDGLSEFIGSALGKGGVCLIIATEKHREGVAARLSEWGFDLSLAAASKRYLALDAETMLDRFMVNGWPDERRFYDVIEPVLLAARSGKGSKPAPIVAFGEMVALLWADGQCEAAIRLEQIWNRLARRYSFSLRCAYPMECFGEAAHDGFFNRICAEHSHVEPTEYYTSIRNEEERLRMVSALQQKAETLQEAVKEREQEVVRRKVAEEKLRRSEEFAQKMVECSVDCVKVLDLEGRMEYMSRPGQRALEIEDIGPFLGRSWVDFWKPEDRQRAEAAVATAKAGGVGSFQGDCPTLAGAPRSWDVRITPALDLEGRIERLIAISRDITELKRAQTAVLQAEKLAATGRLAATIAHEINNPLEAVTNCIYLARTSPDLPEGVCQHLEIADRELARVAQIAQQTLGFYRDNSRQQWIGVSDLVHDIVRLYERRLRFKRLTMEVAVDSDVKIYMKQGELKQALSNLLVNAIDASNEGGRLRLRLHRTKNWISGMQSGVRITLADNGAGIAAEAQRHIFEPFFTTKADVGTGIGLWVTKNLIEKQGGYLRFRSRQGERAGTVMSFFLPLVHGQMPEAIAGRPQ